MKCPRIPREPWATIIPALLIAGIVILYIVKLARFL